MIYGFAAGVFDLLHVGHIAFLNDCRENCDYLMVGLQTNPQIDRPYKNKPIQTTFERWMQLLGCKYVDSVMVYDTERDLENFLAMETELHKRFIGDDHILDHPTGYEITQKRGIETVFIPRLHTYSTTELRKRIGLL